MEEPLAPSSEPPRTVHPSVESFLLAGYPPGTSILSTQSYRLRYRAFPAHVRIRMAGGSVEQCVIKIGEIEMIEREARVLGDLAELGLSVPAVLSGPVPLSYRPGPYAAMTLAELPGQPLPWLGTTSLAEADQTCRLLSRPSTGFTSLQNG